MPPMIPSLPFREAMYLWLFTTVNFIDNLQGIDDTSDANLELNATLIVNELTNSHSKIVIDAAKRKLLKSYIAIALDSTNRAKLHSANSLLAHAQPFYAAWGGGPRHPASSELDFFLVP